MSVKTIFIDTETTGVNHLKNGLFNVAGIICYEDIYEEFDLFCDVFSEDIFDLKAMEKNGYSNEKISKFQDPHDTYIELIKILEKHIDKYNPKDKFQPIGYFSEFDAQFLRQWFINNGDQYFGSWFWHPWIDAATLAAFHLQNERHNLANFQLATVAKFLGIEIDESQTHTALYDTKLTMEIFNICTGNILEDRIVEDDIPF